MTLAEKVAQLHTNSAPAIPRLGVQQYTYWSEGQHGINTLGADTNNGGVGGGVHATSFPTNFASTMSWDPQLVYQETTAISDEARGILDKSLWGTGQNNLGPSASDYGSLTFWAPTVNMDRDPRWGRTDEAFGEDPYLVGQMAGAFVDGYQGETMTGQPHDRLPEGRGDRQALRAEQRRGQPARGQLQHDRRQHPRLLHRAVPEPGRERARVRADDLLQRDQRHPVAGRHLHGQRTAQRTYGFNGYITSDCGAVGDIYSPRRPRLGAARLDHQHHRRHHHVDEHRDRAADQRRGRRRRPTRCGPAPTSTAPAASTRWATSRPRSSAGILSEGVIDNALVHLFTIRMETGEFDPAGKVAYTKITKARSRARRTRRWPRRSPPTTSCCSRTATWPAAPPAAAARRPRPS